MEIIFLTGHRKSGTTLLHKLFDGHPDLNVYPVDLALLYAYLPCKLIGLSSEDRKRRIEKVVTKSTANLVGKPISNLVESYSPTDFLRHIWRYASEEELNTPSRIVDAVSQAWCAYAGLDLEKPFVVKETSQSIHAIEMKRSGLDVKFVQIVRDPRDNYAAIKAGVGAYYAKMGEGEKATLASLINRATIDLRAGDWLQKECPDWFRAIKFEDLVSCPEQTMKGIAKFCNKTFCDSLLRPTEVSKGFYGNSHEGEFFSGVENRNAGRWRDRITMCEAGVIEFFMADIMERWQYDLALSYRESFDAFRVFYNWYNCEYFYYDSFAS